MALINGNEYDHIDFTKNGVTTRHPFKDTLSRQMSSDLVKVQNEEPTSEGTKIWIKPSGDSEVQVPTYEEFEELSDRVDSINTMSIHICTSQEYDSETGIPTLSNPDLKTFYLVPGGDAPNLYVEWIFTDGHWEQFGSATIDLSNYATKDEIPDVPVQDVQVDGTSVLDASGVADIPIANITKPGVAIVSATYGVEIVNTKYLATKMASSAEIKTGSAGYRSLNPVRQHESTFYGLAKAAGDTSQASSANAVGTYTDEAKEKIKAMIGVEEWLTVEYSTDDFADGSFLIDAGEGYVLDEVRMYMVCSTDTVLDANRILFGRFAETIVSSTVLQAFRLTLNTSIKTFAMMACMKAISTGTFNAAMGDVLYGTSNNQISGYDQSMNLTQRTGQSVSNPESSYLDNRYFVVNNWFPNVTFGKCVINYKRRKL